MWRGPARSRGRERRLDSRDRDVVRRDGRRRSSRDGRRRSSANIVASQAELHARVRRGRAGDRLAAASRAGLAGHPRGARRGGGEPRRPRHRRGHRGPGLIGALLVGVAAAKGLAWGRGLPLVPVEPPARARRLALPAAARPRAAVHLPARERRAHAPARRAGPGVGGHLGDRDDARRRRRRGLRQGRAAARAAATRAAPRSTGLPASGDPDGLRLPGRARAGPRLLLLGPEDGAALRRARPRAGRARGAARRPRRELPAGDRPGARRAGRGAGRDRIAIVGGVAANSELRASLPDAFAAPLALCTDNAAMIASAAGTRITSRPTSTLPSMRLLRRPELRARPPGGDRRRRVARGLATPAPRAAPTTSAPPSWGGLVGTARPAVDLRAAYIVVLKTPSVAQRVAELQLATEAAERRWTAEAFAAQQQVLTQLARHGLSVRPDLQLRARSRRLLGGARPAGRRAARAQPRGRGRLPGARRLPGLARDVARRRGRRARRAFPGFDGTRHHDRAFSTPASIARTRTCAAASLRGIDIVGGTATRRPSTTPSSGGSSSGTARSSPACSSARAGRAASAASRPAPPCSRSGSRAGSRRPPDGYAVYARSDQLIAGLDRAVDPNGDGDAHDALRIALVGVAEPFASFADSPEAQAVAGALTLDTLVVAPGGERRCRRARSSARSPGPAARRRRSRSGPPTRRSRLHRPGRAPPGPRTSLADAALPLLGDGRAARRAGRRFRVARARASPARSRARRRSSPAGSNPAARRSRAAAAAGAAAVLVYGRRRSRRARSRARGPVVGVPRAPRTRAAGRAPPVRGRRRDRRARHHAERRRRRIASFSSRGLTFGGLLAPQLAAPGIAIATSDPGSPGRRARVRDGDRDERRRGRGRRSRRAARRRRGPASTRADLASLLAGSARPFGARRVGGRRARSTRARRGRRDRRLATSLSSALERPALARTQRARRPQRLDPAAHRPVSARARGALGRPAGSSSSARPAAIVRVTAQASKRPALAVVQRRARASRPAGGQALRVPWAIVFRPYTGSLLGRVRDRAAVVLAVRLEAGVADGRRGPGRGAAGRSDRAGGPARRPALHRRRQVPRRAREAARPASGRLHASGSPAAGPSGALLPPGSYEIRVAAWPVLPAASAEQGCKIAFRIE